LQPELINDELREPRGGPSADAAAQEALQSFAPLERIGVAAGFLGMARMSGEHHLDRRQEVAAAIRK
jgi:hypothetical protein